MTTETVAAPAAGDAFLVMADLITFRVTDADSGGRLVSVQIDVPPGGGPPPLHIHPPDEIFHVVMGTVTVFEGPPESARRVELTPGQTGHVRGGVPHTFRNFSDSHARLLVTFVPGLMMERFFVQAGHRVDDPERLPELDLEAEVPRVFSVGSTLGMELLSPPQ
jgi:mannose-6-phosphate isomerase-like protein (cupin superfamily)